MEPLLIHFMQNHKPSCAPNALFCALIVSLLSSKYPKLDSKPDPKPWQFYCKSGTPACLYRNCITFSVPGFPGTVTLVDSLHYFKVHTSSPCQSRLRPHVRQAVLEALKDAASKLSYANIQYESAFFCRHDHTNQPPHPATPDASCKLWICTHDSKVSGNLTGEQKEWLGIADMKGLLYLFTLCYNILTLPLFVLNGPSLLL